jgi:hypothetical protein
MKLEMECKILAGAESKAWLVEFTKAVDRLEKMAGKFQESKASPETAVETDAEESEESEDEDFTSAPKKAGRPKGSKNKGKASFDEDDDTEEETETEAAEEEEESEEEEADAIDVSEMKKGKPKKITVDMINDAAKKLAASKGKADGRMSWRYSRNTSRRNQFPKLMKGITGKP